MKKIKDPICIDFDGVLAEYTGWKGEDHLGNPMPGVRKFLEKLNSLGLKFIIFTTRPADKVKKWIKEHNLPNPVDVTNIKIPSPLYIDDRCIKFNGNFDILLNDIKEFNVYWKKDKIFKEFL